MIFDNSFKLFYSAYLPKQIKDTSQYQVAFLGRSNVGKSSLINAVCNKKKLAQTSKTPGRTASINFFTNRKNSFLIVDLPGYGFAKTNKNDKKNWQELAVEYLTENKELLVSFILIDARRGIMASDLEIMKFLEENEQSYQVILTKIDKVKKVFLENVCSNIKNMLKNDYQYFNDLILATSSSKNLGISLLKEHITNIYKNGNN